MYQKLLMGSGNNVVRRAYYWNIVANVLYSLQSAVLLLVITRLGDIAVGGVFSIIYATTHMLSSIGNYNMRNFQVSDARGEYLFQDYWSSRVVTCTLMIFIGWFYAGIKYGISDLCWIFLCFLVYRASDGFEDVIHGYVQKSGRLDVASVAKSIRIFIASVVFCIVFLVSNSLLVSSTLFTVTSVVLLLFFTNIINKEFKDLHYGITLSQVFKLLKTCFPICIGAVLQSYIVNVPRYAIDATLTSDYQTIFNIIFMPVFFINMLSIFIFNPLVADMGKWWFGSEISKFIKCIVKQLAFIVVATIFIAILGYYLGCLFLGVVYGVDLEQYNSMLFILLIFGGISAITTFLCVVVTIMRQQKYIIIAYTIVSLISLLISRLLVSSYGINGAIMLYGLLMTLLMVILAIVVIAKIRLVYKTKKL